MINFFSLVKNIFDVFKKKILIYDDDDEPINK